MARRVAKYACDSAAFGGGRCRSASVAAATAAIRLLAPLRGERAGLVRNEQRAKLYSVGWNERRVPRENNSEIIIKYCWQ